jgi:hypothetical protein
MSILQKEKDLLAAMEHQGYEKMFDSKDDALDFVSDCFMALVDYQNIVINQVVMTPIYYQRFEGEELRDKVQALDERRRNIHDKTIGKVAQLNRICDKYSVPHIAEIDTNDRYAVADFVGQFCYEMYESGMTHRNVSIEDKKITMDDLMALRGDRRDDYDKNVVKDFVYEK